MKLFAELGQQAHRCQDCAWWLPDPRGYSHEGHNMITTVFRKKKEVMNGNVTFECIECGEDATFEINLGLTYAGVLTCDSSNPVIPNKHTIKEAS
mgnify:CR=1 FL=1